MLRLALSSMKIFASASFDAAGQVWEIAFAQNPRALFSGSRARASRADVAQAAGCSSQAEHADRSFC
jgi:hypothetical protein